MCKSSFKNNDCRLHPLYDFEADKEIAKQLYKLKGFAYLRSDILEPSSDLSASRALLKSAKSFQKAQDSQKSNEKIIQKLRAKYIRK